MRVERLEKEGENRENGGRIAEESQKVRGRGGKKCCGRGGEKGGWGKYEAKVTRKKKEERRKERGRRWREIAIWDESVTREKKNEGSCVEIVKRNKEVTLAIERTRGILNTSKVRDA